MIWRKGDDIQERLINFSVEIIKVCDALPKTKSSTHIAGQLIRSGTSPASNHAETRGAESVSDFVHKLKISVKELNESLVWLRLIAASMLLPSTDISILIDEGTQLAKILSASIKTARKRLNS